MTYDIKDIVERLKVLKRKVQQSMNKAPSIELENKWQKDRDALTKAITALTTLSEDNAAMKLEIERLKDTP